MNTMIIFADPVELKAPTRTTMAQWYVEAENNGLCVRKQGEVLFLEIKRVAISNH